MNSIANIELSQYAKQRFMDDKTSNDGKRIILIELFEKISSKDNRDEGYYQQAASSARL